ncbi:MAG TPA: hypothetical protein VF941_14280 [Clostridia bacterium]
MKLKEEQADFILVNYNMEDKNKNNGVGILEDDKELTPHLWRHLLKRKKKKEDVIIVLPDNGQGHMYDYLRQDGWNIIGGGSFVDKIEYERSVGTKLMEDIGLSVPDTQTFSTIDESVKFLEKQDPEKRYVCKPEGEEQAGGAKTYTGKNIEDLIFFLRWLQEDMERNKYSIEKIDLQEFVDGYEVDFSRYFNGEEYLDGIILDMEEKKAGDGSGGGHALGCSTNVIYYFKKSKYNVYFEKLKPYLKRVGYVGDIAINNIISKTDGKPYGLEFTPRFGWDAHLTELSMIRDSGKKISDFYTALVNKEKFDFPYDRVGLGIRVSCMTPGVEKKEIMGRYFSFDEKIKENLWFYCVSKNKDFYIVEDNPVLCANASGKTLKEANSKLYDEVMPKLYLSDAFYRSKYPSRVEETMKFLYKNGWL